MQFLLLVKVRREDGFHLDLDDYLMGLLQMASDLVQNNTSHTSLKNVPFSPS